MSGRATLPGDLDLGVCLAAAHADDDLGDQRAQQLLAVAVGGRGGSPETGQVAGEPGERLALQLGQWRRPVALERRQLPLLALDGDKRLLVGALERARDETVLGLAGIVLAFGACGLILAAFER